MIVEIIKSIANLQKHYVYKNTPQMSERGELIRKELPNTLKKILENEVFEFKNDIIIEGSDGKGNKIATPWVRIASKTMSPNPQTGFYIVIHFSTSGSAFWITIGYGSTNKKNRRLVAKKKADLDRIISWAKDLIISKFESTKPFSDKIDLGSKTPLSKSFEDATVFAKRFDPNNGNICSIVETLKIALSYLSEIYKNQKFGATLLPSEITGIELTEIISPKCKSSTNQGISLSGPKRKAVELRAMDLVKNHLENNGYKVKDCSALKSYDFEARKEGSLLKVEVKGTTSIFCEEFIMTHNEVELHKKESGNTALFLVYGIQIKEIDGKFFGEKGSIEEFMYWNINNWELKPIAYRLRSKSSCNS
ncbi:DUF3578 domain-containing protein [Proteus terrae]|uniref:DUF3578 domain-containing protein n=2 Tax=Proteus terrae TaxID=1574161 RepID=UPI00217D52DA|nr:DUF3578 domain-containing protein [Proteus terrae]MCS6734135.1 DUF3578 domain-containing protein [Proteus terrae]